MNTLFFNGQVGPESNSRSRPAAKTLQYPAPSRVFILAVIEACVPVCSCGE